MLDTLAKIYDDGGSLVGVSYTLTKGEGDIRFISAVGLRLESLSAVFRAVANNDTLLVSLGQLVAEPDETLVDVSNSSPWSECIGLDICWAWRLTNHEGYDDGVRLDFTEPGLESTAIVELVMVASSIDVFVAVQHGAA